MKILGVPSLFDQSWQQDHEEDGDAGASVRCRAIVGLWCAAQWIHALYSLRGFEIFGPRMLPILGAVRESGPFFVVLVFILSAAVHAYYVFGVREEPSPFFAALLPMFRLAFLGDFDLFELEDPHATGPRLNADPGSKFSGFLAENGPDPTTRAGTDTSRIPRLIAKSSDNSRPLQIRMVRI